MPRVGLVLGAGGVVGHAYHAGMLAALEEATGWDPRSADVIVGTSAGAIVGAILRAGLSAADLAARATGRPLSPEGSALVARAGPDGPPPGRIRQGLSLRAIRPSSRLLLRLLRQPWTVTPSALAVLLPEGRVPGDHIAERIGALHDRPWPADPLWICAVRLADGGRVVLGRDPAPETDVGTAVQASSAIPAWFAPVDIDGERYVDGGAYSPTNADVLAPVDLDLVIVSSPMSAARAAAARLAVDAPVRAAYRLRLAGEVAALRARGTPVVTFQPAPDDLAVMGGAARAMDADRDAPVTRRVHETTLRRLRSGRMLEVLAAGLGSIGDQGFAAG